jgi:hypothetical protein
MLRLSGRYLCLVVVMAALTMAARAIPRVLTGAAGASNDSTAVFTLQRSAPRPKARLLSRKLNSFGFAIFHSDSLELFPMFSCTLQRWAGEDRLQLLGAQRE